MRPTAFAFVALAAVLAAGCTTVQLPQATAPLPAPAPAPAPDPRLAALSAEPLICAGAAQCAEYWQRAQAWVARHSMMAITTANGTTIETLAPNAPGKLGFRVVREPLDAGRARIGIATACYGGCSVETRVDATHSFRRFVRTGA